MWHSKAPSWSDVRVDAIQAAGSVVLEYQSYLSPTTSVRLATALTITIYRISSELKSVIRCHWYRLPVPWLPRRLTRCWPVRRRRDLLRCRLYPLPCRSGMRSLHPHRHWYPHCHWQMHSMKETYQAPWPGQHLSVHICSRFKHPRPSAS